MSPSQQPAEVQECLRSWSCWVASTAGALSQFRLSFFGPEVPAPEDMPRLRAALSALIPASEDTPRLREAPRPPPPPPPHLAPAAYLSWPPRSTLPAWREPASARPTSAPTTAPAISPSAPTTTATVVPTVPPSDAPAGVVHSSTPSPNPVEALADALSKPGLEDSCRAAVVGLLLRSTLPSVQEHVQTVYRHGLPVTKDSVPLPYWWEMYKEGDPNAFKQHGKLPEWSREVGDKLRLLWQLLLLHEISARGYLQR